MGSTAPTRSTFFRHRKSHGFTLTEVAIAASILALFIVGAVSTMVQVNRWASAARLRTLALSLVQQKVDEILTTPWSVLSTTPTVLQGSTTGTTTTETKLPLNNDPFNSATGLSSAFTNLDVQVIDTRTTTVTSISAHQVRAVVTVSYTYRARPYSVSMTTMRTTDDF
ncbi:MAG TPA: prepilin-type N-terminal cleavage/methylation domain-containing protein [Chthoniobacter sp.]|nr:prepilin-type N-terminal cleavage/methylation domain-containing protein [Chthoniobacter sp.]